MWGASLPSIHYAFICAPVLQYTHWTLVRLSHSSIESIRQADGLQVSCSATGCILFTLDPRFLGPTFRKYRALMYTCFGLSAILFMTHSILLYGFAVQRKRLAIEWMALMGLLNLLGAVFYASRVGAAVHVLRRLHADCTQLPERWFPYHFDFVGASHQIFHLLVFAAGLVHYKALICALREIRTSGDLCDTNFSL